MTRADAKAIALLLVRRWHELNTPVSGSLSGYRVTSLGNVVDFDMPNRNGDIFPRQMWERAVLSFAYQEVSPAP